MTDENKTKEVLEEFGKRELGNVKVLMVEDDTFFSELVLTKLSQDGCIPYSTGDGAEAINLANQYQPNIIILDLMLPGMSGEDILKELKSTEGLKQIPVIVFSNKSDEVDIQNNLKLGATEFLVKSTTDLRDLTSIVKKIVQAKIS